MNTTHPCDPWLEKVSRRMDGELDDTASAELEGHLDGCPDCRSLADALADDERRLVAAFEDRIRSTGPVGLEAAVLAVVARERSEAAESAASRRPGNLIRIVPMFLGAILTAAALLLTVRVADDAALSPPAPAGPEVAAVDPGSDSASTASDDASIGLTVNDATLTEEPARAVALFSTAVEAETFFVLAMNAGGPEDLARVKADLFTNGLVARTQRLGNDCTWGNPEVPQDLDNVARNLAFLQQAEPESQEALTRIQKAIGTNGGLQSCENLRMAAGSNSYAGNNWNVQRVRADLALEATDADARLYWTAEDLAEKGEFETAIRLCDQVLENYPTGNWADDALYRKGWLLENGLQDFDRAIEAYRSLIERFPESQLAYGAYLNQNRVDLRRGGAWSSGDVLQNYRNVEEQVAGQSAEDPSGNRLIKMATLRKNFLESNLEADRTALSCYLQAEHALERGEADKAQGLLSRILIEFPDARVADEALYLQAETLRRQGKTAEAVALFRLLETRHPDANSGRYAEQARRAVEDHLERQATMEGR